MGEKRSSVNSRRAMVVSLMVAVVTGVLLLFVSRMESPQASAVGVPKPNEDQILSPKPLTQIPTPSQNNSAALSGKKVRAQGEHPKASGPEAEKVRSDMKVSLAALYGASKSFHAEFGRYSTDFNELGYGPEAGEGSPPLNSAVGFLRPAQFSKMNPNEDPRRMTTREIVNEKFFSKSALSLDLQAASSYCEEGCTATEEGFELVSVANLDEDPDLEIWRINEKKELVQVQSD